MYKRYTAGLSVVLLSTILIVLNFSGSAGAFTTRPVDCTNVNLPEWAWQEAHGIDTERNNSTFNGVRFYMPTFSGQFSKYVIGRTGGMQGGPQITMFTLEDPTKEMKWTKVGSVYKLASSDGSGLRYWNMIDAPKSKYIGTQYENSNLNVGTPTFTTESTTISCVWRSNLVQYDTANGWDLGEFTAGQLDDQGGAVASTKCNWNDMGCWVTKIGNGLTDTIKEMANALVRIFIPSGANIQTMLGGLNTTLTNKLGFLVYPFTFINDLVYAFTTTTFDSYCTTSSCPQDFGSFFGKNFTVNISVINSVMPTVWTFILYMIRGLTVLGLILMFKSKFQQINTGSKE